MNEKQEIDYIDNRLEQIKKEMTSKNTTEWKKLEKESLEEERRYLLKQRKVLFNRLSNNLNSSYPSMFK